MRHHTWEKIVSSECLIPHRKEDYEGVLKIESKLWQLLLDNIIRGKKKTLITKMDKPSPTLTWPVECSTRALVFCCPPNHCKHKPTPLSTPYHLLPPYRGWLPVIPCLLHNQRYQQGQQVHWLHDQGNS